MHERGGPAGKRGSGPPGPTGKGAGDGSLAVARAAPRGRRVWLYPLAGLLLAQGAPLGLLVLRRAAGRIAPGGVAAEIARDPLLYGYLGGATAAVMAVVGAVLGRLEDRLEQAATHDALTGLLNRRAFDVRLGQELARALRFHAPLSLVILDLDGFKAINDAYGHREGDRILARVGGAIRAVARTTDAPCRYGGEEFAIVCPSTTGTEAENLAERLRQVIPRTVIDASPGTAPGRVVTASFGVSELDRTQADPLADLIQAADRALYRAKALGRDRVVGAAGPAAGAC